MKDRYDTLDVNNKLIWNLRDIAHTMHRISEGKGGQKRILILLEENGTFTQRELTQRLEIRPGSVSEVLAKLESTGLIERTTSQSDRRTANVRLTENGRQKAQEAAEARRARHERMFACLSGSEKAALLSLLEKLNTDWEQQYKETAGTRHGRASHGEETKCCGISNM